MSQLKLFFKFAKKQTNETKINTVPKCNINNTLKLWNWYDVN